MSAEISPEVSSRHLYDTPIAKGQRTGNWYMLGLLTLIYAMGTIDRAVISVVAEPLKHDFGLDDKQIGLLGGMAYSVTYALAVLPAGWLTDRGERRTLLSVATAIWSVFTVFGAVSSSFALLVLARMGVGAAEAPATPGSLSVIADIFPKERRNTAISIYHAAAAAGQIVIFVIGGWLLMHFGWRTVFLVAGGPGLLLAALLRFTTKEPVRGAFDGAAPESRRNIGRRSFKDMIRSIWGNAALAYAILGITIGSGVAYSVTVWSTSLLVRVHHMTVGQGAIWTGVGFGICMTVGTLLAGPIADRFSRGDTRRLALIPGAATAFAIAAGIMMLLAGSLPLALVGLSVLAFMAGFFVSMGYSLTLLLADPHERGTTMAATRLISTLFGSGLIPFVTGALSDAIGGAGSIRLALLLTVLLLVFSLGCYARIYRMPVPHSG
jgi:MFS family permease